MSWTTTVVEAVYQAAVVSGLTLTYSVIATNFYKMRSVDLGRLDFEDAVKLILLVTAAIVTRDCLVKQGVIPGHI